MQHLLCSASLLAALAEVSVNAAAPDWWWIDTVGSAPARTSAYVDRASFEAEGQITLAWSVYVRETPKRTGERSRRALIAFSCADGTTRLVTRILLDATSEVLEHRTFAPQEQREEPVVPDSLTESAWNFVCGDRSGAEKRVKDVALDLEAAFSR